MPTSLIHQIPSSHQRRPLKKVLPQKLKIISFPGPEKRPFSGYNIFLSAYEGKILRHIQQDPGHDQQVSLLLS